MSETNDEAEDPTTVYFTDGTATAYSVVIRQYDSDWLYALRPDTPANHCVLNTENVTRIEAQTVISVEEGVSYCDFDWRDRVETLANQDLWIAAQENITERGQE
ncbi:hypothetical protein [Halalkalicoccus ordinarius]|uniref:hypothetical protein n=1 Tax=Halalkalicoccus ordinarius TaxID=3116651 RepID=UPI00300EE6D3